MKTIYQQDKVTDVNQIVNVMANKIEETLAPPLMPSAIKTTNIVRLKIQIPQQSALRWLIAQKQETKTYWSDREHKFEMAGLGIADKICLENKDNYHSLWDRLYHNLKSEKNHLRYYGGFRFDHNQTPDKNWAEFGSSFFILPRFELLSVSDKTYFVCNLLPEKEGKNIDSILSTLNSIIFKPGNDNYRIPRLMSREDFPDKQRWLKNVKSALDAFQQKRYDKIVLARKTSLVFNEPLEALGLLLKLKEKSDHCYHFCFQSNAGSSFIGVSPERFYYRKKDKLFTEAVAGTRVRGQSGEQDQLLGKELLHNQKEIREHRYVVRSLLESFMCLSNNSMKKGDFPVSLLKLNRVQHLVSTFEVHLKKNITDANIIESLHPTAAVGGYPQKDIQKEINRLESFDRGWYAAPVGWIGKDEAEFAVAIRSGLVMANELFLYAGAGIVEGSQAEREWDEVENKIGNFLKVLD
ncbi:MAG: isochorismate synthase [FCB group bacterium]|nr:isochorismate synthase [FCB group bacterium]